MPLYETPDRRLMRLRSALDSTAQSMGQTVSDAVDLEARRRAMEDNLRRFREVGRRQQQPRTLQEVLEAGESPLAVRAAGGRVDVPQFDPGRGLIETVGKGIELEREAEFRANKFILEQMGTPPEQFPQREEFGAFQGRLTEGQRENLRGVPLVGPALEREAEFLSSPAGLATTLAFPTQIAAGAVGGVATATGAQELGAGENVQLAAQVAGNVLAPGGGIVPAAAVTRPAQAAARTGRELVGEAAERARLAPEAGARPLGESTGDSVLGKLRAAGEQAPESWLENARLSREEFGKRATRAAQLRDKLIAEGVSEQEAILKSTAELRGEMPFKGVTGLDFSPQEEAWFWDRILSKAQYAEGVNVADYMQQMMRRVAVGEAKDFPPFIWRILGKAFGEDFTNQLQVVIRERIKAVKVVAEESAAERLAKAPTPKGVTDKTPLPPEFGGEQLPIRRVPGAPEPSPQRTFAEGQQFRAEIELEASPKPKGVSPSEVADPTGAEQGILRDAAEQFPAPGVDLQGVQVAQRETFLDLLSNTVGVLKPLLSSLDISWFRQIGKTIVRHPRTAFQSLRRGTTALWSQEKAVAWMDALRAEGSTTTGYRQLVRTEEGTREIALGKLLEDRYLSIPGTPGFGETPITRRPEFFMSEAAQMVPGIRQSGRGFAVGWNTNYQGMMRYWLNKLTKMNRGVLTQAQVDAALNLGERLTGVGKLGKDNSWFVKALKVLGFAPGYRVSGPEALATLLSPRTNPLIRRMAAENLISWALMGNGLLTAAKYGAGATVVTTLGASQFGRVKFPGSDTYYNIWGTDNVLARAVLQAIQQQRVDVKGNISVVGSGEKTPSGFLSSFTDSALNYLKSGEAPAIGLFEELRTGETFIGKKLGWDAESAGEVLKNRLPIVLQDFMDLLQTEGPLQTLFSIPPGVTGTTGITSYTPTRETFRAMPKYNSADKDVVESVLGRTVPEPLNLTPNEERSLLRFLREDVKEWIEDLEDKHGPMPSSISMVQVIQKVGGEKGLKPREIMGAIFLHKAKSNSDALNPAWIQFALQNRAALEDFYPSTYEADYMQAAQQRAEGLGLVPVR